MSETAPRAVSDAALARRAALGDRDAFAQLADRHGPALYRYVRRLVRDDDQAADCLQETFLAAWMSLPGFRGDSTVRTWLFGVATRQVYRFRSRWVRYHDPLPEDLALVDPGARPEDIAVAAGLLTALEAGLRRLPPTQRACWLLREVEELSYEEIALVLGTSTGAVRGQLHRARGALSTMLEEWR
ncbi:RNA polymerase, sigma-24 subunit, ECF subfamily [Beutenbergia cavernae DSM 12333]|uniref:RNA polymerase, sigma-24 subunit, ECF subfamily n=1 Tax=Beutenbergia cavernae (strain ATCC BAA-8 / DSM 12333 / CCUG 43141 / JCM 11478 / NBRC 16432 / NCIMB 13614 / HKI 0122) TaxID=471853 RepID=C5C285_BEUC1|nr:sigma-70 family RNA polymerase sigma factor [Beutenbergia cavernae]ACQ81710.1 RNA polymerase, sigma-24 subunit, ECF subfamily [Beutenbergia cavernae DSM 12333]